MCQKWGFEVFSVVKNEMNWLVWIMFDKLPFLKHDAQLPATSMKVQFDHIV